MTLEAWQRNNLDALFRKCLPHGNHELAVLAEARIFPSLPIHPSVSLVQVIGLAWKTGFISSGKRSQLPYNLDSMYEIKEMQMDDYFVKLGWQLISEGHPDQDIEPYVRSPSQSSVSSSTFMRIFELISEVFYMESVIRTHF